MRREIFQRGRDFSVLQHPCESSLHWKHVTASGKFREKSLCVFVGCVCVPLSHQHKCMGKVIDMRERELFMSFRRRREKKKKGAK